MTKINRVFEALVVNGEELTAKQIRSRFDVANPHNAVYEIRRAGYPIYLNRRTDSKGRVTHKYRFGNPSRSMVALAYRAMSEMAD